MWWMPWSFIVARTTISPLELAGQAGQGLRLAGDEVGALLLKRVQVGLRGVVEVVAGPGELGLEARVAVLQHLAGLEVHRVGLAVEQDVDDRARPLQRPPVADLLPGQGPGLLAGAQRDEQDLVRLAH